MSGNCNVFFIESGIDTAIKTIARLYKWEPKVINEFYIDEIDCFGLIYWFKDAQEYIKEINKSLGALH